jgi:hypothetical protein
MIDDDRLILESRANWYFGRDNSGDIRLPHNLRWYWQRYVTLMFVLAWCFWCFVFIFGGFFAASVSWRFSDVLKLTG